VVPSGANSCQQINTQSNLAKAALNPLLLAVEAKVSTTNRICSAVFAQLVHVTDRETDGQMPGSSIAIIVHISCLMRPKSQHAYQYVSKLFLELFKLLNVGTSLSFQCTELLFQFKASPISQLTNPTILLNISLQLLTLHLPSAPATLKIL